MLQKRRELQSTARATQRDGFMEFKTELTKKNTQLVLMSKPGQYGNKIKSFKIPQYLSLS